MHHLENFKNFAKAQINLFNPLTILIGPNGSGKTNLIEGVELLSKIALGQPLYEISQVPENSSSLIVRGGLQACPREKQEFFTLGFSTDYHLSALNYFVSIKPLPEPIIRHEKLTLANKLIFETIPSGPHKASKDIEVMYNNFKKGAKKPKEKVAVYKSILSQYETFATNNAKRETCLKFVKLLKDYLQASFFFDPNPKLMREYENIGNNILYKDCSNLSSVLYALKKNNPEGLNRLLVRLKQVPDEPFENFSFVTTELNHVIFGLQNSKSGTLISAEILSDGTLRCLAILTALETVKEGSRVVLEEFDNGLHPSRINILIEALHDCCTRRKLNVLVTTHNPGTLNALQPEQLKSVVACVWDAEQQANKLVPLIDIPNSVEFFEQGRLGDLVTRKILDRYLSPNFSEERKARMRAWLESLP